MEKGCFQNRSSDVKGLPLEMRYRLSETLGILLTGEVAPGFAEPTAQAGIYPRTCKW